MADLRPHDEPFERFAKVFDKARASGMDDPNAMVVSSVGDDDQPSSRVVLLKEFDSRGFVFYTNLESQKGREILARPKVALNFFWRELDEQIRVRGTARPVADEEADAYFKSRPRGSQLGAWASRQSQPMRNRAELLAAVARIELQHPVQVPRPSHWSGFRVEPDYFEFWVSGTFRLHDRTVYEKTPNGWSRYKLFP